MAEKGVWHVSMGDTQGTAKNGTPTMEWLTLVHRLRVQEPWLKVLLQEQPVLVLAQRLSPATICSTPNVSVKNTVVSEYGTKQTVVADYRGSSLG